MKKQCVVITAYKEPETLRELLRILNKKFYCFVHIDKKVEREFECVKSEFKDVHFMSNYKINWGGVEHLSAIVDMLRQTLDYEYSYVHIISGEDFPTQDVGEIERYFEGKSDIYLQSAPCIGGNSRRARWYRFYWPYAKFRQNYKKPVIRYMNLFVIGLQVIIPFMQRKSLGEFKNVFSGLVWSSLPRDAVEYILDYLQKNNMNFNEELEWCKIPEELCFQTILSNSNFANYIVNDNKRYGNFSGGDGSGPVYLQLSDIEEIDARGCLFARKIQRNSDVMDILKSRQKS